jgi:rubrerythrin
MTTFRRLILGSAVLIAGLALIAAPTHAATGSSAAALRSATLDNLQTAYSGESNARAKYLAFAEKADKDGYPAVASLFRAAADAEGIHANNHAVLIKEMGATPTARIETPAPKTTADNLKAAIAGEIYERDTMYPEFVKIAKAASIQPAVRSFALALQAEAGHARLYTEMLKQLAAVKGQAAQPYRVCPVCGFTTPKRDLKSCPACATPAEKFRQVA